MDVTPPESSPEAHSPRRLRPGLWDALKQCTPLVYRDLFADAGRSADFTEQDYLDLLELDSILARSDPHQAVFALPYAVHPLTARVQEAWRQAILLLMEDGSRPDPWQQMLGRPDLDAAMAGRVWYAALYWHPDEAFLTSLGVAVARNPAVPLVHLLETWSAAEVEADENVRHWPTLLTPLLDRPAAE